MSKKIPILSILLISLMFISGCSQQVRPSPKTYIDSTRVFDRNYEIGQKLAAYVGQPIVKVKDYKVKRFNSKHMKASDNFIITGGGVVTIVGNSNTDYRVKGDTTMDGVSYTVVSASKARPRFGVLVDSNGGVHNKILNGDIVMFWDFDITPKDLKFTSSKDEEIDVNSGYLNYELIFGGTDGKSITISYREYTSKDMARPAFYQNLVYEVGKEKIRFKDTVIKIHSINSEQIVYTVLSDGLTK
jgi:hypothetical protein